MLATVSIIMPKWTGRVAVAVAVWSATLWSLPAAAETLDLHAAYCLGRMLGLGRLQVTPDQTPAMQGTIQTVNRKTDHAIEAYQAYLSPRGVTSAITAAIAYGRSDATRRKETIDQCLTQGVGPAGLTACIGDDNAVQTECLMAKFLPF